MQEFLLKLRKPVAVSLPDRTAEGQIRDSTGSLHMNQASLGKFFEVVGNCGGGDHLMLLQRATRQAFGGRNLLQHGEPTRISDGAADRVELLVCEFVLTARLAHTVIDAPATQFGSTPKSL